MKKYIFLILFTLSLSGFAQELNMKITVNASKLGDVNQSVFTTLEEALNQFVNGRKWTDATFASNEQIDCNMLITLESLTDQNTYKGTLQVTSSRPVYNSSYTTPLFNFRDTEFEFSYLQGENLQFNENNVSSNLTAVVAFYAYIILGLDFDSFALDEGKPYFEKAFSIANNAQSLNTTGWAIFGNDKNRYALSLALTEESSSSFHTMWYNYHRKGLDDMASNSTRGRTAIEETVPLLQTLYQARPASPLISIYGDTKLDELMNIYSTASTEEKRDAYKILESMFPTKRSVLEKLKK